MFLPMSWTSPFTVAITILPCDRTAAAGSFSASMYGIRWATAFFITRADFTTWGRNILPAPNRSPTTFMPAISGPSITSIGRPPRSAITSRSSSVSASTNSSRPFTSAWVIRSSTGIERHSWTTASCCSPVPAKSPATSTSRSVASGRRLRTTSSIRSRSPGSISS